MLARTWRFESAALVVRASAGIPEVEIAYLQQRCPMCAQEQAAVYQHVLTRESSSVGPV